MTVSKTVRRGSSPWRYAKLCSGGGEAQRNGLQIRKTVSSNLTRCSIYSFVVKWYNNRLITGHYKFNSCRRNHSLSLIGLAAMPPCLERGNRRFESFMGDQITLSSSIG